MRGLSEKQGLGSHSSQTTSDKRKATQPFASTSAHRAEFPAQRSPDTFYSEAKSVTSKNVEPNKNAFAPTSPQRTGEILAGTSNKAILSAAKVTQSAQNPFAQSSLHQTGESPSPAESPKNLETNPQYQNPFAPSTPMTRGEMKPSP